jgi:hypothetical protein
LLQSKGKKCGWHCVKRHHASRRLSDPATARPVTLSFYEPVVVVPVPVPWAGQFFPVEVLVPPVVALLVAFVVVPEGGFC